MTVKYLSGTQSSGFLTRAISPRSAPRLKNLLDMPLSFPTNSSTDSCSIIRRASKSLFSPSGVGALRIWVGVIAPDLLGSGRCWVMIRHRWWPALGWPEEGGWILVAASMWWLGKVGAALVAADWWMLPACSYDWVKDYGSQRPRCRGIIGGFGLVFGFRLRFALLVSAFSFHGVGGDQLSMVQERLLAAGKTAAVAWSGFGGGIMGV
ncbi:hypothetical protein AKJ16_DCAP25275 [Drosera capensis]